MFTQGQGMVNEYFSVQVLLYYEEKNSKNLNNIISCKTRV